MSAVSLLFSALRPVFAASVITVGWLDPIVLALVDNESKTWQHLQQAHHAGLSQHPPFNSVTRAKNSISEAKAASERFHYPTHDALFAICCLPPRRIPGLPGTGDGSAALCY